MILNYIAVCCSRLQSPAGYHWVRIREFYVLEILKCVVVCCNALQSRGDEPEATDRDRLKRWWAWFPYRACRHVDSFTPQNTAKQCSTLENRYRWRPSIFTHARRCKTSLVGQSVGLSVPRLPIRFRPKLQKESTFVRIELRAKLLDYFLRSN